MLDAKLPEGLNCPHDLDDFRAGSIAIVHLGQGTAPVARADLALPPESTRDCERFHARPVVSRGPLGYTVSTGDSKQSVATKVGGPER